MTGLQRPFKNKRVLPAIGLVSLSLVVSEAYYQDTGKSCIFVVLLSSNEA